MRGLKMVTMMPCTGYGEAGLAYLSALRRLGVPITWTPMVEGSEAWGPSFGIAPFLGSRSGGEHDDLCNRPLDYDRLLVHVPPAWQLPWRLVEPSVAAAVYTTWEADRLPEVWVSNLNRFERVLVPSTFNQRAFAASGVTARIGVVPHCAPRPVEGGELDLASVDPGDYVFYTIGSWTTRKALEETIRAYLEAFSEKDPVVLVVKTGTTDQIAAYAAAGSPGATAPEEGQTWWSMARILADYRKAARVCLLTRELSRAEIAALHQRGDCFVSLSHGEGWGLGCFEAVLAENPVVVTGWSGPLDYLREDYPLLVPYELEATSRSRPDGWMELSDEASWARADAEAARTLMRWVFEHRDEAREQSSLLAERLRADYAPEVVGRLLRAELERCSE